VSGRDRLKNLFFSVEAVVQLNCAWRIHSAKV
jgi:hypothetical protein